MTKEELIAFLRDSLSISVQLDEGYSMYSSSDSKNIKVKVSISLQFEDETIKLCDDSDTITF